MCLFVPRQIQYLESRLYISLNYKKNPKTLKWKRYKNLVVAACSFYWLVSSSNFYTTFPGPNLTLHYLFYVTKIFPFNWKFKKRRKFSLLTSPELIIAMTISFFNQVSLPGVRVVSFYTETNYLQTKHL